VLASATLVGSVTGSFVPFLFPLFYIEYKPVGILISRDGNG